ncbi:DUF1998 domain-containing protein [Deinococcus peraridilitoris]|uniref:MrfA-like Zn-binding domain-containing protein n=1 Tax=Deinococcus peraridilitoris (strain DSM 19664 / LMG 22246 / CIP 109416 / KR-200) TaxID=937777 RepID=K9ZZW5_DEIPD|nr:DUF1998 domain-containing protein [Deinococcus peraridilitoris]AFZ67168.1 protein of unknown function (DUF1998) [Deinococcus peraridilitoris DSM 19664]
MSKPTTAPVGTVRPSQLLWTYGPGALVDLPNLSVVTMGLDLWRESLCEVLDEPRLLAAVRRSLGPQVERLRKPPVAEDDADPFSAEAHQGVPVRPFPRWLRCVRCGLLAEYDSGLFDLDPDPFRPERTSFVHTNCDKGKKSDAVPARFLLACGHGHLDDFPWHWFVHGGPSACRGTLRFFERGASLQTENLWVRCDECESAKSLAHAFGEEGRRALPACRGRHPHLDRYDSDCEARPRAVVLGATNAWFPVTLSALAIPLAEDRLGQFVQDAWEDLKEADDVGELKGVLKTLRKRGRYPVLDEVTPEDVWSAMERERSGAGGAEPDGVTESDMKRPEWTVLTSPSSSSAWPHFLSERVAVPAGFEAFLSEVSLVKRLREVNALLGFSRIDSPEEIRDISAHERIASLTADPPRWVPASEVHGEGVFLRFDERTLRAWEGWSAVGERDERLRRGHRGWRTSRELPPEANYPGVRFAMLHTLSHLLIREFALECGYGAASIRERIYAEDDPSDPMAGILLYTAAPDSDGTLGGLVELGKPENLGRIMIQALRRARICSSDPLCSEHDPGQDRSLHAAACHACNFVAETSCERGNRYLDRALLVPTFECSTAAFFGSL